LFLEELLDLNHHQSSKEETMVSQVNRNVDSSTLTDSTFVSTNLAPTEHTQLPKLNPDHQLVLEEVQTQPPLEFKELLEFKPQPPLEFKPQPPLESKPQPPLEPKPQPLLEPNKSQELLELNKPLELLEPNQLLEPLEPKQESEVVPHLCLLVEDHHLLAQIKHVVMLSQDPMKTLVLVIWLTTPALVPMVV
jgi:hypothetical protein